MDFLLDPNFAYLILLGGIVLTLLAIAAPGTGALEIGAVFCFLLTGYAAYKLSVNWWALVVLLLSVVPFAYAVKSRRTLFLGASILLLVIGSVFLFARENEWTSVNPILALVSSGALAAAFWVVGLKFLQTLVSRPTHDLEALLGQAGEARTVIHHDGSAYVNGELWSARSDAKIAKGSHVRVISREGFTLVVEKME
jgi:membrane-bound serine protease (ClpP class)